MDVLRTASLDHIALSGLNGASFQSLEDAVQPSFEAKIDEYVMEWIWKQVKQQKGYSFFVSNNANLNPIPHVSGADSGFADLKRKELPEAINMKAEDIIKQYGQKFRIVAPRAQREQALGLTGKSISDVQFALLDLIGQSGPKGVLQSELPKMFGIDARSMFFNVRTLELNKLIAKTAVIASKGTTVRTHTLRLWKLANATPAATAAAAAPSTSSAASASAADGDVDTTVGEDNELPAVETRISIADMEAAVCRLISKAEKGIMRDVDVQHWVRMRIGKSKHVWTHLRDTLVKKGSLELLAYRPSADAKPITCVRFIQMPLSSESRVESAITPLQAAASMQIVAELPIEQQIYKMVVTAAESNPELGGVFLKDIKISGVSQKLLRNRVETMARERGVAMVPHTVNKYQTWLLTAQVSEEERAALKRALKLTANNTAESAAAAQAEEASAAAGEHSTTTQEPSDHPSGHKKVMVTVQAVARLEKIMEIVRDERVVLSLRVRKLLEELAGGAQLDSKTFKRSLDQLVKEGTVEVVNLVVPQIRGTTRKFEILKLTEIPLDSEEFLKFKELLRDSEYIAKILPVSKRATKEADEVLDLPEFNPSTDGADASFPITRKYPVTKSKTDGIATATAYGFLKPAMLRVKLMHRHLWRLGTGAPLTSTASVADVGKAASNVASLLPSQSVAALLGTAVSVMPAVAPDNAEQSAQPDADGHLHIPTEICELIKINRESQQPAAIPRRAVEFAGSVSLNDVLTAMTTEQYLQIIGCSREIPGLEKYRDNGTIVGDLPAHVRSQLMVRRTYVQRLHYLVGVLEQLGLVVRPAILFNPSLEELTSHVNSRIIQLARYGQVFDVERGTLSTYDFTHEMQYSRFWAELEAAAVETQKYIKSGIISGIDPGKVPELSNMSKLMMKEYKLPDVCTRPNAWQGNTRLSKVQKAALISRMPAVKAETPDFSHITPEVARVAQITSLSGMQVLVMYRKLQSAQRMRDVKMRGLEEMRRHAVEDEDINDEPNPNMPSSVPKRQYRKRTRDAADLEEIQAGDEYGEGQASDPKRRKTYTQSTIIGDAVTQTGADLQPKRRGKLIMNIRFNRAATTEGQDGQQQSERDREQERRKAREREDEAAMLQSASEMRDNGVFSSGIKRRNRVPWKQQEDLLLLRIIANQMAQASADGRVKLEFLINFNDPAALIDSLDMGVDYEEMSRELADPRKTPAICRKRMRLINRKANNIRILQAAIAQRAKTMGISSSAIGADSDLSSRLIAPMLTLPRDINTFRSKFTIKNTGASTIWQANSVVYSPLGDLIKTILMYPEQHYIVDAAKQLIFNYPLQEVDTCFSVMRDEGLIVRTKGGAQVQPGASSSSDMDTTSMNPAERSLRGFHISGNFNQLYKHQFSPQFEQEFLRAASFCNSTTASTAGPAAAITIPEGEGEEALLNAIEQDESENTTLVRALPAPGQVASLLTGALTEAIIWEPIVPNMLKMTELKNRVKLRRLQAYASARNHHEPRDPSAMDVDEAEEQEQKYDPSQDAEKNSGPTSTAAAANSTPSASSAPQSTLAARIQAQTPGSAFTGGALSEKNLPNVQVKIWRSNLDDNQLPFASSAAETNLNFDEIFPEDQYPEPTIDLTTQRAVTTAPIQPTPASSATAAWESFALARGQLLPPEEWHGKIDDNKEEEEEVMEIEEDRLISSYLEQCKKVFLFIEDRGASGATCSTLRTFLQNRRILDRILTELTSFGLIIRVLHTLEAGYVSVTANGSARWVASPFNLVSEGGTDESGANSASLSLLSKVAYIPGAHPVVFQPWHYLNTTINQDMLRNKFILPIASLIMKNPGIYESAVVEKFPLFRPAITFEIVDLLIRDNVCRSNCLKIAPIKSLLALFQAGPERSQTTPITEEEYVDNRHLRDQSDTRYERCLYPTVDGMQRLFK